MNAEILEWIRLADMDMATAHHMFNTFHPIPLEIVCFHSQQAVEKMLKCYLISKEIEPLKTHDMQVLIEMCVEISDDFNQVYEEAASLTKYAVRLRYPSELGLIENDAAKALEYAERLMAFVKKRVD